MLGELLTAIVTPFRRDGSVDLDSFRALARHLVDNGSDGLVVTGTTGESPTLSDDERLELLRVAGNPIAIKAALNLLGHDVGGHRLPLVEATHDERDRVRDCLSRLGLLQPAVV